MLVLIFCVIHTSLLIGSIAKTPEPRNYPSQGEIWPKAWREVKTSAVFHVDTKKLQYTVTGKKCSKIELAIERCNNYLITLTEITKRNYSHAYSGYTVGKPPQRSMKELQIYLSGDCENLPYYGMNESYNLTVSVTSVLNSTSVWGIIRGMETFSQLFYLSSDFMTIQINRTDIIDHPNYPYRGFLLNTGSHFLSTENILKTIDAMAMNKLNVLHWRIVDDESFSYQSLKFPELSRDGAYHSSMVYSRKDMEKIRDHAKDLGIRVMIEFDIPGHSYSIGMSHPEILTQCNVRRAYAPPMNPLKNRTYEFLKEILNEIQELFPDDHFHIGGDDVEVECWEENREIVKYMQEKNLTTDKFLDLFYSKVFAFLKEGTVPVVWQDVFSANVSLPNNTLVQIWNMREEDYIIDVLEAGYRGIQSAPYFLNELSHDVDWLYAQEPRKTIEVFIKNATLLQNLVGVTICMWGEMVDDTNVLSQTWPRASAVAEVLWSETKGLSPNEPTIKRIEEQTCRMRRRGVPASPPIGPGFCLV